MVRIIFWDAAERDLRQLSHVIRKTVLLACRDIFDDWNIGKSLTGPLSGYRVYRVGVYRILYVVRKSSSIEIVAIGHRRDVYKR